MAFRWLHVLWYTYRVSWRSIHAFKQRFCLRNMRCCNVSITDGRGFMNYAVEMGLGGAMIYTPSFVNIGSTIQKLIGWIHIQTHTHIPWQEGDLVNLLLFFLNKGSKLKECERKKGSRYGEKIITEERNWRRKRVSGWLMDSCLDLVYKLVTAAFEDRCFH
jgi:hypothetical protein